MNNQSRSDKKVLFVSFDYPPSKSVAGQRTLRMTQYLPEYGWTPIVLTAKDMAYEGLDSSQEIPSHMQGHVYRTGALDVDRHLSIKGKHFGWMKTIDRWSTWIPTAIVKGIKLVKKYKPDVIVATYPTMSAHIVGNVIAKYTGVPLILDYQDPYAYVHKANVESLKKRISKKVENSAIARSQSLVFVTNEAAEAYRTFHNLPQSKQCAVIENGYDESNFQKLNKGTSTDLFDPNKFSLYYSGVLYPDGRDPKPLFNAIHQLKNKGVIGSSNFELIFQGSGTGEQYDSLFDELGIASLVKFVKPVSFLESLQNMMDANGLCLIQDGVFELQIPGKLYEYIRAKKPILVCAPRNTATANEASSIPYAHIGATSEEIASCISTMLSQTDVEQVDITAFSRQHKAKMLAAHLNGVFHG